MARSNRNKISIPKLIAIVLMLVLVVVLLRMLLLVKSRANLAEARYNAALTELKETESLAINLERQAAKLSTDTGRRSVLKDRYGMVSENEGYLILLHQYPSNKTTEAKNWWEIW